MHSRIINLHACSYCLISAYELYVADAVRQGRQSPEQEAENNSDQASPEQEADNISGQASPKEGEEGQSSSSPRTEDRKPVNPKDPRYTKKLCTQFKRTLCHEGVGVHFVGAWYVTVSIH